MREKKVKDIKDSDSKGRNENLTIPSVEELTGELQREKFHRRYKKVLRSTVYTLVIVAAISVLVATLLLPVLQIYGKSMNPNLYEGDIVVSVKSSSFKQGDIVAFYYNNRVLVKRIIGMPGDVISIKDNGDVYVNNELLDEPYLSEKSVFSVLSTSLAS